MGFRFVLHLSTHHCFRLSYKSCGFGVGPIIQRFTKCLNTLFLNSCSTQARLLGVADSYVRGFMNFVHSKLPRVTKSFVNKSLSKFVKKCFGIGLQAHTFFENIHSMCKHCPIVVFHIVLGNVYIMFEQCKTFFVYFRIRPLPWDHSFIFSIALLPLCSPYFDI